MPIKLISYTTVMAETAENPWETKKKKKVWNKKPLKPHWFGIAEDCSKHHAT